MKFTGRLIALCFLSCGSLQAFAEEAESASAETSKYQQVEWIDIMPKDDLEALMNPPEYFGQIADGSSQDNLEALNEMAEGNENIKRFQSALTSTRIVETYLGKDIRIPGFIVPLEGEDQTITEFFIVPFFGACLHMPPPPPNQIIHVEYKQGVELENLYDPFWFEGRLKAKQISNDLGASAYGMTVNKVYPHEEG